MSQGETLGRRPLHRTAVGVLLVATTALGALGGCAPPPPGPPPPPDACVPATCASLNVLCGEALDGCGGHLSCGLCDDGSDGGAWCIPTTCAELGLDCGRIVDGCFALIDCGPCPAGQVCGKVGVPNVCVPCVQQTDAEFCAERKATCGSVRDYDNCNVVRTVECGTCPGNMVCGASGKAYECGCVAPTTTAGCQAAGMECGILGTTDSCGNAWTLYCGTCRFPAECGVEGVPGQCGCAGADPVTACPGAGVNCGPLAVVDRCGVRRTLDCGTCTAPQSCGGGGTPGQCGQCQPKSDAVLCAERGAECGTVQAVDNCGAPRTATCAPCLAPRTCGGGGLANACSPSPLCTTDTQPPGDAGVLALPAISAFYPLCDGEVVIGNASTNAIDVIDVVTGIKRSTIPLTARPGRMALNRQTGVLFAGLSGATSLARVDLQTRAVSTTFTSGVIEDVTLDASGRAWALSASPPAVHVVAPGGLLLGTRTLMFPTYFVVISPAADRLLTLDLAGYVDQYAVDPGTLALTYLRTTNVGTNCNHAELSPDGLHLAVSCGHGNTAYYDTLDFDPFDFSKSYGAWAVGAYPVNGRFSADSTRFVSSKTSGVRLFDVATHAQLGAWPPLSGWTPCSYGRLDWSATSRGNRTVYGASQCGFNDDTGIVYWWPAP